MSKFEIPFKFFYRKLWCSLKTPYLQNHPFSPPKRVFLDPLFDPFLTPFSPYWLTGQKSSLHPLIWGNIDPLNTPFATVATVLKKGSKNTTFWPLFDHFSAFFTIRGVLGIVAKWCPISYYISECTRPILVIDPPPGSPKTPLFHPKWAILSYFGYPDRPDSPYETPIFSYY